MSAHDTIKAIRQEMIFLKKEAVKDDDYMFMHALAGGQQIEIVQLRPMDDQLIFATGHDASGRQAAFIAHHSQVVVTFTFIPKKEAKQEPVERIGFLSFKEV